MRYRPDHGAKMSKLERGAQVAIVLLAFVVVTAALKFSQDLMAPLALALVIGVVLSPISDMWERLGFPAVFGALTSLILTLLFIVFIAMMVQPVVVRILEAWPTITAEMRGFVVEVQSALRGLEDASKEVQGALTGEGAEGSETPVEAVAEEAVKQAAEEEGSGIDFPTTTDALFLAPAVAGQTVIFAGVLFFFLLTRREVYDWIAHRIAPDGQTGETAMRLRLAERQVARYFLTISVINVGLGLCAALVMGLLGVPSPYIWGVTVTLLNFVLYLGPAIVFAALGVTGIVAFDGAYSLAPALSYLGLNLIEAQFVTPSAIGRQLSVNPLLIFVALIFFLWLWGPLGGFVAIPLLLWAMVLGDEIKISARERARLAGTATPEADTDAAGTG